jgi:hypothetical protein
MGMAFKLIESAQRRWRVVNAPHLVAHVRAGAMLVNGKLVERPADPAPLPYPTPRRTQSTTRYPKPPRSPLNKGQSGRKERRQ